MTRGDRGRASALALVVALAAFSASSPSLAGESDEAAARALFADGRRLVDAGNYAEACPKFEESLRLYPGAGTKFNLADCFEHLGRTASAWSLFLDVASASRVAERIEREQVARRRAAALEPKLTRLVVEVVSAVDGLAVERDGVAVGVASLGIPIPVDPGEHRIAASAPAKKGWSQSIRAPSGSTIVVSIPMLEAMPPPGSELGPPTRSRSQPALSPGRHFTIPTVVVGSLGLAALTTSAVLAFEVQSENEQAKGLCAKDLCASVDEKSQHDRLLADARRNRTLAYAGAGIGVAAVLTAIYLWWQTDEPEGAGTARTAQAPKENSGSRPALRPRFGALSVELEATW